MMYCRIREQPSDPSDISTKLRSLFLDNSCTTPERALEIELLNDKPTSLIDSCSKRPVKLVRQNGDDV